MNCMYDTYNSIQLLEIRANNNTIEYVSYGKETDFVSVMYICSCTVPSLLALVKVPDYTVWYLLLLTPFSNLSTSICHPHIKLSSSSAFSPVKPPPLSSFLSSLMKHNDTLLHAASATSTNPVPRPIDGQFHLLPFG